MRTSHVLAIAVKRKPRSSCVLIAVVSEAAARAQLDEGGTERIEPGRALPADAPARALLVAFELAVDCPERRDPVLGLEPEADGAERRQPLVARVELAGGDVGEDRKARGIGLRIDVERGG